MITKTVLSPALVALVFATATAVGGCSSKSSAGDGGSDLAPSSASIAARPYAYEVPDAYDGSKPVPLLVLLHGYSADGYTQAAYFGLLPLVNEKGFLLARPNGTIDKSGARFWNATDACCDFGKTGVDDVAYVSAVIADMKAHFNIDPKRVFVTGHSNGGYMSHRFACERASTVAAFVALAGDDWLDETRCMPSEPVPMAQVHGDADASVVYTGMAGPNGYPSARDSVAGWAKKNGCVASPTDVTAPPLDLDATIAGNETTVEKWTGCKGAGTAELWTIHGGSHLPNFRLPGQAGVAPGATIWAEVLWSWLMAHPKP